MKDVIEAAAGILKDLLGLEIQSGWIPYIVVITAIGPWLVWGYLSIRRWRGDFKAISGELEAATRVISHDTKREFDSVLKKFSAIEEDLRTRIDSRFDALHQMLKSTTAVEEAADEDIEKEAAPTAQNYRPRLNAAESVRNSVIQKWLEGRTFRKLADDAHIFIFEGISTAGSKIRAVLQTPYRASIGADSRLPYTLEVWADGYKKLNFEWDLEGRYALRGFKKGDWIEDLALWHFGASADGAGSIDKSVEQMALAS